MPRPLVSFRAGKDRFKVGGGAWLPKTIRAKFLTVGWDLSAPLYATVAPSHDVRSNSEVAAATQARSKFYLIAGVFVVLLTILFIAIAIARGRF